MNKFKRLIKKLIPSGLFSKIEPFGHLLEAIIANILYGFPAKKMHIIGVTGTNGKTTTTFMIHHILNESGIKSALSTTVGFGIGEKIVYQTEKVTTASPFILQKRLRDFQRAGVNWVVLETSSHALAQNRVWGIPYEIAVMTNLTYDHLDYHKTFERYSEAKRKLFSLANKNGRSFGVVNADDKLASKFASTIKRHISYGINDGEIIAKNIKPNSEAIEFDVKIGKEIYKIYLNMIGEFNVYNSLAAIAVAREIGIKKDQIENSLATLKSVQGRVNFIDEGQPFKVIVDFASTPDAFEKIFSTIKPLIKGKLVVVFGAPGQRDETKRPVMGKIAAKYADEVVITEDDDRDADGNAIRQQILEGSLDSSKKEGKDIFLVADRKEAIRFALGRVKSEKDAVLLLGKGHEKTIERNNETIAWNEIEVTRELLKDLKNKI